MKKLFRRIVVVKPKVKGREDKWIETHTTVIAEFFDDIFRYGFKAAVYNLKYLMKN